MCQVGILPTDIHYFSVCHHYRMPIRILIESQTAQVTVTGVIQNHITNRITTVYTRYALITDIGDRQHTSVRQIGSIEELQIRFRDIGNLLSLSVVDIQFMYLPSPCRIQSGKHQTFSVPVQYQVGNGRTVPSRFIKYFLAQFATLQARQFNQLSLKVLTAGRT